MLSRSAIFLIVTLANFLIADTSFAGSTYNNFDKSLVSLPIEQIAHRRTNHKRVVSTPNTTATRNYDTYNGFGTGGSMNADDDFAFGGYDPDLVVDYRNGWNVSGPYGYSQGFGPGYGIGMWGW
jgi:hypothetical protein